MCNFLLNTDSRPVTAFCRKMRLRSAVKLILALEILGLIGAALSADVGEKIVWIYYILTVLGISQMIIIIARLKDSATQRYLLFWNYLIRTLLLTSIFLIVFAVFVPMGYGKTACT